MVIHLEKLLATQKIPAAKREFILAQIREIKNYRKKRSKELGYDAGIESELEWIEKFASEFRKHWVNNERNSSKSRK